MTAAGHEPSNSRYTRGCRCLGCRDAHRAYMLELRQQKRQRRVMVKGRWYAAAVAPESHGKPSTYIRWGCRCEPCTAANRNYMREYHRRARSAS